MMLKPLKAVSENVDVKRGGLITYETDVSTDQPGIILVNNPTGDYGMTIVDQVHSGGKVIVRMRPSGPAPVKKYSVGDIIAQLAIF